MQNRPKETSAALTAEAASIRGRAIHSLPAVWPGYIFAAGFVVVVAGEGVMDPSTFQRETFDTPLPIAMNIALLTYLMFCVYRIHLVLAEITGSSYSTGPWKAVGLYFIPFYSFYWVFIWPSMIAKFVNGNTAVFRMAVFLPGIFLLIGLLTSIFFDVTIGTVIQFSALLYIRRKVARIVPA